jgi:hypothetical protein
VKLSEYRKIIFLTSGLNQQTTKIHERVKIVKTPEAKMYLKLHLNQSREEGFATVLSTPESKNSTAAHGDEHLKATNENSKGNGNIFAVNAGALGELKACLTTRKEERAERSLQRDINASRVICDGNISCFSIASVHQLSARPRLSK